MRSWREGVAQSTQDDVDRLAGTAIEIAVRMLGDRGVVLPFGLHISSAGDVGVAASGEADSTMGVIALIRSGLRQSRDGFRAVAVVCDVSTPDGDAVRIELDHVTGTNLSLHQRYEISLDGVELGAMAVETAAARIWDDS